MSDTSEPSGILIHIIATFLMPLFLGGTSGNNDPALARRLATDMIKGFQFRDGMELLLCAQAIGFSLISLGSMALSVTDGLSTSMILRLRGNANACTRSAGLNRRALATSRAEAEHADLRQAELDRCAQFDAAYPDEQMRAEVAETQAMAAEATARLRDRQGRMELVKAMQEMTEDCDRRLAAEIAGTGVPRDIAPVAPRAASVETMTMEAFLAAPDAPRLIGSHDPRPAALSEPTQPAEVAPVADEPATVQDAQGQAAAVEVAPVEVAPAQPAQVQPSTVTVASVQPAQVQLSTVTAASVQPSQIQPSTVSVASVQPSQIQPSTVSVAPAQPAQPQRAARAHSRTPQPVTAAHPQQTQAQTQIEDDERRTAWANAMMHVAAEFATDLPNASPEERRVNKIRTNALNSVARTLLTGAPPRAFEFKLPNALGSLAAIKPRRR